GVQSADIVQFVDILLRFGPTKTRISVGAKLFNPAERDRRVQLPDFTELSFGFYPSARNCQHGFMLNVDRSTCVSHSSGDMLAALRDRIWNLYDLPVIPPKQIRELNKEFKDEKIVTKEKSVVTYFNEKYSKVKYPNLPIVDVGTKKKLEWYPVEVCELLPDQYVTKLQPPHVLSEITTAVTRQKPNTRFIEIKESVLNVIQKDGEPYLREFGMMLLP
ncbi:translation initiation factor 2C-like protein, partial [Leptotrombidium deliense]